MVDGKAHRQPFFIFLCLLIVLQIYWRYRPPALLKSSIDFVIQLKEKFNGWPLALIKNWPLSASNQKTRRGGGS
jgi:hypothetical protein